MAYAYRARDPLGKMIDGLLEAGTREEAAQQLRRDGFQVLSLEEEDNLGGSLIGSRVSRREIVYTTAQLAVMVDTGITLSSALDGIIAQERNPKLKTVLTDIKRSVESGDDFSSALERHPACFDKTYIALVRASEATGTLGEMLDRISNHLRRDLDNRNKVLSAMAYPGVMFVLAIGVTIFLLTYVLPKFTPLFNRKGVKLPAPTVVMMAASELLINYWYFWIVGMAAGLIGLLFAVRTGTGRRVWDAVKINLPILGPTMRKVIISRSVNTLGTMIGSGVSVLEAIRLTSEVAGNYHYRRIWENVREQVTSGRQICDALQMHPLIPATLVQMVAAGEQSGRLDTVLQRVSGFYDREVEAALKTATSLIEPLMICVMGVVVGGIAISLLLPIFTLSKQAG
ncbi:MAG: type II secretion system F family protein [Pirellulales bacterium]